MMCPAFPESGAVPDDMRCDLENCGICQGGRDYRGMRWWPQPVLTYYAASEQKRGRKHWFTTMDEITAATAWPGP